MDRGRRQRGFKFSAGDWTCSNGSCRNVNFARRDRCNLCNKERDDRGGGGGGSFGGGGGSFGGGGGSFGGGGGSFRDEGRGRGRGRGGGGGSGGRGGSSLFAPEDWDCPKCGNVNWARRDRCFRCDAPKGMGGGGGSDRGRSFDDDEIGYTRPDRSGPFDDDYDDFKRRPSEKPFGQRPLFEEDECGPMDVPSMRNGSRFEGSRGRGGGGGGGFRGRGGGGRGRGGGGGGFRGRGGGFRGRDRSRSPLNDRF